MGISGGRSGIEHTAGDYKACCLAKEILGIDEEGVIVGAVGTFGNMIVLYFMTRHECRATST